jgi:hypothetical protein
MVAGAGCRRADGWLTDMQQPFGNTLQRRSDGDLPTD